MSALSKIEAAQNDLLQPVLTALMEAGAAENEAGKALASEQREAALLVAGILTGVKIMVMQAGQLIREMELDELVE